MDKRMINVWKQTQRGGALAPFPIKYYHIKKSRFLKIDICLFSDK